MGVVAIHPKSEFSFFFEKIYTPVSNSIAGPFGKGHEGRDQED